MHKYEKLDTHLFKKENPGLYNSILKTYKPVFDRWVAIAMFFANDPPPTCEICNKRVTVAKKQAKRCQDCLYIDKKVSYEQFCDLYELQYMPVVQVNYLLDF